MRKRQLKKFAKKAVQQMKGWQTVKPLQPWKMRNAMWLYLYKDHCRDTVQESKIYREFWNEFDRLNAQCPSQLVNKR